MQHRRLQRDRQTETQTDRNTDRQTHRHMVHPLYDDSLEAQRILITVDANDIKL